MGNTLITANENRNIRQDTLLGKEISKILREKTEVYDKDLRNGKLVSQPTNQIRACCLDVIKENPGRNDFITIKLPEALDETNEDCKNNGKCIGYSKVGLQFPFKRSDKCSVDFQKGGGGVCDRWMVNKCAKELYDAGCLTVKKNSKGKLVKVWNANNKNCFNEKGELIYGSDECACINSATGYNLNRDPSNKIKGGLAFENNFQNPYGLTGSDLNNYTKYSLNVFGYDPQYQMPQLFDSRCASRINAPSSSAGENAPYLLPGYENTGAKICLNQINVKDSSIGEANFSNIQQNNNCGAGIVPKVKEEESPETKIDPTNKVDKREGDRVERAANELLKKDEEAAEIKRKETEKLIKEKSQNQKEEREALERQNEQKKNYEQKLKEQKEKSQYESNIKDEILQSSQEQAFETSESYNKLLRENKILKINNDATKNLLEDTLENQSEIQELQSIYKLDENVISNDQVQETSGVQETSSIQDQELSENYKKLLRENKVLKINYDAYKYRDLNSAIANSSNNDSEIEDETEVTSTSSSDDDFDLNTYLIIFLIIIIVFIITLSFANSKSS